MSETLNLWFFIWYIHIDMYICSVLRNDDSE